MTDAQTADLHTEIRRLRVRAASLDSSALDVQTAAGRTRRQAIRAAVEDLGRLTAPGVLVPSAADRALGDQLAVMLGECTPAAGCEEPSALRAAVELAAALRRELG